MTGDGGRTAGEAHLLASLLRFRLPSATAPDIDRAVAARAGDAAQRAQQAAVPLAALPDPVLPAHGDLGRRS